MDTMIDRGGVQLHARVDGAEAPGATTLVFANSLGTDLRLWDKVLPLLPPGLRFVRYDKRGHGRSSVPPAPYAMGALVADAEAVMEALAPDGAVFVGLSVGGLIGQGLATKRPDLVRALVLADTAARIGTPALWQERIDAVRDRGMEGIADSVIERWFGAAFRASDALPYWRQMLVDTPAEGYCGTSAAISGTDFFTTTAALRLPCLGLAGSEDRATPPDLVRETTALVEGARFELIRGAGHLPPAEAPEETAAVLTRFLTEIGAV